MANPNAYYKLSGKTPTTAIPVTLSVGTLSAAVLGFAYAVIIYYMPFVYINALCTIAFGIGLGFVGAFMVNLTKIRNPMIAGLLGLLIGLFAEYAQFVAWLLPVSEWNDTVFMPGELWAVLKEVNKVGVWGFSSTPVKGMFLWIIWMIEALIIIGASVGIPYLGVVNDVFCERCDAWADDQTTIGPFKPIANPQQMKQDLEDARIVVLADLEPADDETQFSLITLTRCNLCNELFVMTLQNVKVTYDKEGKPSTDETDVIRNLLIDQATHETILTLADAHAEESDDAGTPDDDIDLTPTA